VTADTRTPHPGSARELKAVLGAERTGVPFLLFRDAEDCQQLRMLDDVASPLTLGRSPQADVTLAWDEEVSAVHAELHSVGGEWALADDGLSVNGTFVNGMRLAGRQRLRDGDTLRLGRTLLVYRASSPTTVSGTVPAHDAPTVERLADTQRRVLVALCRPYRSGDRFVMPATNQQIGEEVFLGVDAVKAHLRTLYGKFGLDDLSQNEKRVRLAECALKWGLVSRSEL
jgi:pSer/pThr/pTyr-binding forkhead associated (FHA) protein